MAEEHATAAEGRRNRAEHSQIELDCRSAKPTGASEPSVIHVMRLVVGPVTVALSAATHDVRHLGV